jgi:cell division protein FtsI/penicillin-binding protein 2
MGIGLLVITARLAQLQIVDHDEYTREARLNHISEITLNDRRGALLDRSGYPLAASQTAYNVMVERDDWSDPAEASEAAQQLAEITGVPAAEMLDIVRTVDVFEVPVAKNIEYAKAVAVRDLGLSGVRLLEVQQRVYPEGNIAAQLLGYVGQDNNGITGLEWDLDPTLVGAAGSLTYERDGLGREIAIGDRVETPPLPGGNVVLTIDRYIQRVAEQELAKAIKQHEATGGTVIIVQPQTGEILAMASQPTFDITKPDVSSESAIALFRNRAISDPYEPGSVFKLFTMAAALDQGLVSPGTSWYDNGRLDFGEWTIRNWDNSTNGTQSVQDILTKSLNTGAAWLSDLCGPDAFYDYVGRFGFGAATTSGLSGETGGTVRSPTSDPTHWAPVDMATNSFGQGLSATPLQVAMALAAIANNGTLMKPQFVKEVAGPTETKIMQPESVRQVITPESARTLLDMMGVVSDNTSRNLLDVQGYRVGGKSGTANIGDPNGGYKPDTYISSYAGVAPLDNPQIAVLVKIDEPKDVPWGTVVAAPAFDHIAEQVLAYLKVPPTEPVAVSNPDETDEG